jgi:hypothetical protein
MRRLPDLAVFVGVLCLAAAIGEGRFESAKARERHDPLLWQLQVFNESGALLRSQEVVGKENQPLALADPISEQPQLQLSILPLGLPDGGLDVQLRFAVNGSATIPLQGFKITPGETIHLDVPGQPYRLALRATRLNDRRLLVS